MPLTSVAPRESTVDACARALREAVLAGEFAVGARLPTERALASTLAVNRVTVRGALARLVAEGLLQVRQGSGYLVRDYLETAGPELISALATGSTPAERLELTRDLLEVRRAVARVVLERLVKHRPPRAALERVVKAVDELERVVAAKATAEEIAAADVKVLGSIVAVTGSVGLRLLVNPMGAVLLKLPKLARSMFRTPADNVAGWRLLLEWLRAPTPKVDDALAVLEAFDLATLSHLRRAP